MKRVFALIVCFVLIFQQKPQAQGIKHGFEVVDLIKISEAYRQSPNLSFDLVISLADSVLSDSIIEKMLGSYKMHNTLYWAMMDSVEYLQGSQYNLAVYHKDTVLTVSDRTVYTNILNIPLLDSLFREANIDSMYTTSVDDSTSAIHITFNPGSGFQKYLLFYDKNSYYIRTIQYYVKEYAADPSENMSGTSIIKMLFQNYSTAVIDPAYFDETKFIYRTGNYIYAKPAYTSFRLFVNMAGVSTPPL